jgi:hypothetical protein
VHTDLVTVELIGREVAPALASRHP